MFKKSLILAVFLVPLITYGATLQSCQPGDTFDIYTGKACVVATNDTSEIASLKALIVSLQTQVATLQAQLANNGQSVGNVTNSSLIIFSKDLNSGASVIPSLSTDLPTVGNTLSSSQNDLISMFPIIKNDGNYPIVKVTTNDPDGFYVVLGNALQGYSRNNYANNYPDLTGTVTTGDEYFSNNQSIVIKAKTKGTWFVKMELKDGSGISDTAAFNVE